MKMLHGFPAYGGERTPRLRSTLLIWMLVFCLLWLPVADLFACAMSALISVQGTSLSEIPRLGEAHQYWEYNDPWDYFAFVMANSNLHINDDGYGVVSYQSGNQDLSDRGMWYKRVLTLADFGNTYYTGSYLAPVNQPVVGNLDILDHALQAVMNSDDHPAIVLCHARNASGLTYGNHPFWFQYQGKTFTFMHNGNVNSYRGFLINRINQMYPDFNWFIRYPSNYFYQTDPYRWVDSELLFRYIMCHVITSDGNVLGGLHNALYELRSYLENPSSGVCNFIMSDGEKLYAFRNTPLSGGYSNYRLSYRIFDNRFYAIRTLNPGAGDIELDALELVVFSRDAKPSHYPNFTRVYPRTAPHGLALFPLRDHPGVTTPEIMISPNPVNLADNLFRIKIRSPLTDFKETCTLELFNLRGQKVLESSLEQVSETTIHEIALPSLTAGVYLCRVKIGTLVRVKPLSIIR